MASEQDDKMDALRRGFYSRFWKDIAEQQATPETSERSSTMASEELTAEVLERLERLAEDQPTVWIKASTLRALLRAAKEREELLQDSRSYNDLRADRDALLRERDALRERLAVSNGRFNFIAGHCGGEGELIWSHPGGRVTIVVGHEGETLADAVFRAGGPDEPDPS